MPPGRRGRRLRVGDEIEHGEQQLDAGHAVDEAVMHAADEGGAIALEAVDERDVPKRPVAREHGRENLA